MHMSNREQNDRLLMAVHKRDIESFECYTKQGAGIDGETSYGVSPLTHVIDKGDTYMLFALLRSEQKKDYELEALHRSVYMGKHDLVKDIVQYVGGWEYRFIDQQNGLGNTALHIASACNDKKMVQVLLGCGARLNIENNDGLTPKELAEQRGFSDISMLLDTTVSSQSAEHQDRQENEKPMVGSYAVVKQNVVVQYMGEVKGQGSLRLMFDFNEHALTKVVGDSIGLTTAFTAAKENAKDIHAAHKWMREQGYDVSLHTRRQIQKRK